MEYAHNILPICIAGKFGGGGGVWERKFGELIDQPLGYYQFGWLKFGESWTIHQICQTSPTKPSRYMVVYVSSCLG